MTRFRKFFAVSLLTLVASASTMAGEMSFPRSATGTQNTTATGQNTQASSIDYMAEVMLNVIGSLLPVF